MPTATSTAYPHSHGLNDVPEEGQVTPSHGGQVRTGHEYDLLPSPSAPHPHSLPPAPAPSKRARPMSMPPQSAHSPAATAHISGGNAIATTGTTSSSRRADSASRGDAAPRKSSSRVVGEYNLGKTLGAGSMGKVKLAHHITTGERLAVKIVPRPSTSASVSAGGTTPEAHAKQVAKDASKEIRSVREASLSMLLHHPYICGMRDFIVQPHNYFMVMDYVNGGQLLDYIISHGRLRERVARKFARQIASALDYCHRNNVVHRDLKIENILISANGNIKLIDFGLSNLYNPAANLQTFCGSLYFAAPELLNARAYTGPEVDVWSFGVVLYVLVCGKVPFDDQSMPALHAKIKRGVVEYPVWLSADCKALLARILVTNPTLRATMHEVTRHPWMLRGFDGPQSVHFPKRTPLRVEELDPMVIRGMTGFEFGSEKEIMRKLIHVLESEPYQRILRRGESSSSMLSPASDSESPKKARRMSGFTFYTKKLFPIGRSSSPSPSGMHNGSLQGAGSSSSIFEPSSSLANALDIDATRGFHPLISIYYLVREKQERERIYGHAVFASSKMSLEEAEQEKERQRALEPIAIPDTSRVHNGIEAVPSVRLGAPASPAAPSPRPKAPDDALVLTGLQPTPPPPTRVAHGTIGHGVGPPSSIRAPPASTHRRSQSLSQRAGAAAPWAPQPQMGELGEVDMPVPPPRTASAAVTTFAERVEDNLPRTNTVDSTASGRGSTLMRRFGSMLDGRAERRRTSLMIPRTSADENRQKENEKQQIQQAQQQQQQQKEEAEDEPAMLATSRSMPIPRSGNQHKRAATGVDGAKVRHERRSSMGPALGLFAANTIGRKWRADARSGAEDGGFSGPEQSDTTDEENLEQADRDFKPLFMKGLFSVQTTSTKSAAVLHLDLRRVLDRMQIQHRDIKGGFECLYAPSIDLTTIVPGSPMHAQQTSANGQHSRDPSTNGKLVKKNSKLSFIKVGRNKDGGATDAESIRSSKPPTMSGMETDKDLPPRPSVSGSSFLNIDAMAASGGPNSAAHGADNDALSARSQTLNGTINGAPSGTASAAISRSASPTRSRFVQPIPRDFAASPVPADHQHVPVMQVPTFEEASAPMGVRFEVHIVKVPLLPLHGIQFRRVSGDIWQYQMLARRVLTELKL